MINGLPEFFVCQRNLTGRLGHDEASFGFDGLFVRWRDGGRHVEAEGGAQINFMVLFLHDGRPQRLA
jgi:hypothetical protein